MWMNLKNIYAEWEKLDQNTIYCIISLYEILENTNKTIVTESRSMVTWGETWGKIWTIKSKVLEMMDMFCILIVAVVLRVDIYTKTH